MRDGAAAVRREGPGGLWRGGDLFVWLSGGALALALLMVAGLVGLVAAHGLAYFWPREVEHLALADGTVVLGEVVEREAVPGSAGAYRIKVKQGNRDLTGQDFRWIPEALIVTRTRPREAMVVERREWGHLYGTLRALADGERIVAQGPQAWPALFPALQEAQALVARIRRLERVEVGAINRRQERIRLALRRLKLRGVRAGPEVDRLHAEAAAWQARYEAVRAEVERLRARQTAAAVVTVADGREVRVPLAQVVRVVRPNTLGWAGRLRVYGSRLWEFFTAEPREANTEGGVFPAIFGTVLMVLLMTVVVTPLGVLAALYLREYARQGPFTSAVRIAVNNLAGVPSIVFGVFGVGFFIYLVGGTLDRLFFPEALPTPTLGTGGLLWASLTLALLTVPVVIVTTEEGLAAVPPGMREAALALGATRLETTVRVVLPAVLPSILTGLILAMARAAGEVAPLMLTGVVKLAPALPVDGTPPFVHLERKFMHLGFHIYDVGFQSPNVDAARPMVFATTLLLLGVVICLNLFAIALRARLRRRLAVAGV